MRTNIRITSFRLAFALLWLLHAGVAGAWGALGHRITAYAAEPLLTERTRQQLQALLGAETLADASTFMDTERKSLDERWPDSARWHYDNQPVCAAADKPYCADGQCATQQIERFRKLLKDKNASPAERGLALKLLIHMLGDIHQPLHMADNADRGGNDLYVQLQADGETYRLHEVFDTLLIRDIAGKRSAKRFAGQLLKTYGSQLKAWQQGNLSSWAQDTHRLAVKETYGGLPQFTCNAHDQRALVLPPAYLQSARAYLPEQLAKAGARMAAVLNSSLE